MAAWLLKTEPDDYSIDDLERDGTTVWDGVANNAALMHMRAARAGERCFIYHTGRERQVVGIGRLASDPYPDPASSDERLVVFDVAFERRPGRTGMARPSVEMAAPWTHGMPWRTQASLSR